MFSFPDARLIITNGTYFIRLLSPITYRISSRSNHSIYAVRAVFFIVRVSFASTVFVLQIPKNIKSRSSRDFIFCLLEIIPQTPRTKISSLSHAPYGAIFPDCGSVRFSHFSPALCRGYIRNSVCAGAFL